MDKLNSPAETGEFQAWVRLDPRVPIDRWHQDFCHGFGTLCDGLALSLEKSTYLEDITGFCKASSS